MKKKRSKFKLREPVGTLGNIVKKLPNEEVTEVIEGLKLKTKPLDHQARSLYLSIDQDRWIYALDMGLGKTKLGLDISTVKKEIKGDIRVLVTCPSGVIRHWGREIEKHSDLTYTLIDHHTAEKKLNDFVESRAEITVVSHTWLVLLFSRAQRDPKINNQLIEKFEEFDTLIVDEAHILKNPQTKTFAGYRKFCMRIPRFYMLTGTPIGNSHIGIWALYYLLDRGDTFGKSYYRFLDEYFHDYYNGKFHSYFLRKFKLDEFSYRFWKKMIRWEEDECNNLPEKTYTILPVKMSKEQERSYDEVVDSLNSGEPFARVEFQLMRITAGLHSKRSPKFESLCEVVDTVCKQSSRQLIVWCWLRDENDFLREELKKKFKSLRIVGIKGDESRSKNEVLENWKKGKIDVLIANQKSFGVGIDLFESNVCVFYSNNRSLIDRKQSEKRIHRIGQKRHCTYIDIVCEDTIDEINLGILQKAYSRFNMMTKDTDIKHEVETQRKHIKSTSENK